MNSDNPISKPAAPSPVPGTWAAAAFAELGVGTTAYIRGFTARQLKDDGSLPPLTPIPDEQVLFAIHAANGVRLAIMDSRDAAFMGARQNDLEPLSVH